MISDGIRDTAKRRCHGVALTAKLGPYGLVRLEPCDGGAIYVNGNGFYDLGGKKLTDGAARLVLGL